MPADNDNKEPSLWRSRDLTPPGRLEKLSPKELQRWREQLTTALRRHEYLLSPSGQMMIETSTRQSIARLTESLLDFRDWVGNEAQDSLKRLKKQMTLLESLEQTRLAKREGQKESKTASDSKLSKANDIIGDDPDIRAAIVKKHGSVEAFALSL